MKNNQNFWQVILNLSLITIVLLWINDAAAENLAERIGNFPNWENKPLISAPKTDLIYPDWMAGNWNVESTLIDMVAPLAPKIITPGFEKNRQYLYQPVNFQVKFIKLKSSLNTKEISEQKINKFSYILVFCD